MRSRQVQDQVKRLERELRDKCVGSARVNLEHLDFPSDEPEAIDVTNVTRLVSVFERQGCFHGDSRHYVPAVIEHQQLYQTLQSSGVSPDALLTQTHTEWPELRFPSGFRLQCLDGRHRIQAGRDMAPPQRWWTVDLYLADLHDDLRLYLAEQISNEKPPSDGQIYRKIRQHSLNPLAQARWWACLTENKAREMKRLLRRDDYRAAFDALLDIPSLWWDGLRLGMTKFVLDSKCDEEMLHCLDEIRRFWADLFRDDERAMRKVDPRTVKALEVHAPGVSSSDAISLFRALKRGELFGAFGLDERMKIWARLYTTEGFVPTLWTFFENFKYIKACAECVKSLVRIPSKATLFGTMEKSFSAASQRKDKTIIQEAEGVLNIRSGLTQDRIALHYRQLFLYVMRHLRELSPKSIKLERSRSQRRPRTATDNTAWYGLVDLAERLGFRSVQVAKLKLKYSKYAQAHSHPKPSQPTMVVDRTEECFQRRYASPFDRAYDQSRDSLFLDKMHNVEHSQESSVTPFFVRKSVYLTFIGRLESGHSDHDIPATRLFSEEPHAPPTSTSQGLPLDQPQTAQDHNGEVTGQGQGSESYPDLDIVDKSCNEQTAGEMSEDVYSEREDAEGGDQENDPDHTNKAQGYVDQLPDMTDLFDSPPASQSLQLYREPKPIENVEEAAIHDNNDDREWDSTPPSILSSSFYSEGTTFEEEAGYEEQAPPDEGTPLQQEAPFEGTTFEEEAGYEEQAPHDEDTPLQQGAPFEGTTFEEEAGYEEQAPHDEDTPLQQEAPFEGTTFEEEAGYEEQAPHDEGAPLQQEAPFEGANPIQNTASVDTKAEGTGWISQDRFRFLIRDGDDWVTMEEYSFTTFLSSLVEITAEKHAGEGRHLFDTELWSLHPSQCYEAALAHGAHTILLFPGGRICIDKQLAASAAALCPDAGPLQPQRRKRAANEDVSRQRHLQKRRKH